MKPPLRCAEGFIYDNRDDLICDTALFTDAHYIVAAVNACHAAGLTVEQLEGGTLDQWKEQIDADAEESQRQQTCEHCGKVGDGRRTAVEHNEFGLQEFWDCWACCRKTQL